MAVNSTGKIRWSVSKNIHIVCGKINKTGSNKVSEKSYKSALTRLCDYFKAEEKQVWILCFAVWYHFANDGSAIFLQEFAEFLSENVLTIVSMNKDFQYLCDRNLISFDEVEAKFSIKRHVIKAVVKNQRIEEKVRGKNDYIDFILRVADKYERRKFSDKTCLELVEDLCHTEKQYSELPIVDRCTRVIPNDEMRFMFYDMCSDYLNNGNTNLMITLSDIYEKNQVMDIGREYINETSFLQKKDLIKFVERGTLTESTMTLTEKGKKLLFDTDYDLYELHKNENRLISPEKIIYKDLFYSDENRLTIQNLAQTLAPDRYSFIINELKKKNFGTGICILFYGVSGTGKTESVYQLAKKTGRKIYQVNISNMKSCWFGESEKQIKKVFQEYNEFCKANESESSLTPILLFNEADAVFGKRKDTAFSSTAQTENAMQNIILEEMEKFQGIMIATTNLVDNFDPAFERRFLFKLKFNNPSVLEKKYIWKSKINWLSEKDAEKLSVEFNFTGGEIDNIARKIAIQEIVSGERADYSAIKRVCDAEKVHVEARNSVGFKL